MYPEIRQNKHTCNYRFLYWNQNNPEVYDYSINTNQGFQVAESAAGEIALGMGAII